MNRKRNQHRMIWAQGMWCALSAILMAMAGLALPLSAAQALTGAWSETDHGRVRLVAASDGVGGAPELRAGLEFEAAMELVDHYWRYVEFPSGKPRRRN